MADKDKRELEVAYWKNPNRYTALAFLAQVVRAGHADTINFRVLAEASGLFEFKGVNGQGRPEYKHIQTGMLMVELPPGEFLMGSPDGEGDEDEHPQHKVVFKRPFLMGKYTVQQAEWRKVMGANPSHFQGKDGTHQKDSEGRFLDSEAAEFGGPKPYDQHPVDSVSWDDCQEFSKKTGLRLPSEAQWEYACRAGTTTRYHSGDTEEDLRRVAWFGGAWEEGHHAVGLKEANNFGLHDMHGNVFEWCQDRWHPNYQGAPENGFTAWDDDTGYNATAGMTLSEYAAWVVETFGPRDEVMPAVDPAYSPKTEAGDRVARAGKEGSSDRADPVEQAEESKAPEEQTTA